MDKARAFRRHFSDRVLVEVVVVHGFYDTIAVL
jgi:hypothetical protein